MAPSRALRRQLTGEQSSKQSGGGPASPTLGLPSAVAGGAHSLDPPPCQGQGSRRVPDARLCRGSAWLRRDLLEGQTVWWLKVSTASAKSWLCPVRDFEQLTRLYMPRCSHLQNGGGGNILSCRVTMRINSICECSYDLSELKTRV